MKLRCQICFEWIAEVDMETLAYPMRGFMFKSIDPHHGFEAPFPASLGWEDFRCPYGPHRPMIKDNEIQTDEGIITLPYDGGAAIYPFSVNTERTVKRREPIKKHPEDVPVQGVREGIQNGQGEGRLPKASRCEICGKEFEKEINLRRHILMAHKGV